MSTPNSSEHLTLRIDDLSRGGAGVARDSDGRVIFVPLTAPGDLVEVKLISADKRYAQAELVRLLEPSPLRQEPPCAVFGRCGGCQWQHIPYDFQWKTKVSGVKHALNRTDVKLPEDWDEHPAEDIWEYRNRVQLRGFEDQIGFFARRSRDLVPIDRCEIAHPEINRQIPKTREEGKSKPRPYKVEIEALPSGETRQVWNSRHGALGFRQIHDGQNLKLQNWILNHIPKNRILYDLYGGSGNLSRHLADQMDETHCVDVSSPRERDASLPSHYHFHRSDVLRWIVKQEPIKHPKPAVAIVDPPREGLLQNGAVLEERLRHLNVQDLIAVGCDPDSWARDVSRLSRKGWNVIRVAVFDFFPQTPHVESVAFLRREI